MECGIACGPYESNLGKVRVSGDVQLRWRTGQTINVERVSVAAAHAEDFCDQNAENSAGGNGESKAAGIACDATTCVAEVTGANVGGVDAEKCSGL